MKKLSILGLLAGTALLGAVPVSLQLSPQHWLSVSLDSANAEIGRPLTPGSVAGVHRRVERRTARRGYYGAAVAAGAIGAGAYYGAYGSEEHYAGYDSGQYYNYVGQGSTAESTNGCAERFRSYNPATGMYVGYDGLNHSCP